MVEPGRASIAALPCLRLPHLTLYIQTSGLDLDLSTVPMVDMADLNFPEFQDLELPVRVSCSLHACT
jgi:hypothetical protein